MLLNRHHYTKEPAGFKHDVAREEKQNPLFSWWKMSGKTKRQDPPDVISEVLNYVRLEERSLIGQELHDNVNQILMSAKMFLEILHPQKKEKIIKDRSLRYIAMAIEEIRRISLDLVGEETGQFELAGSINRIIADIHMTTPVRITLHHNKKTENLSYFKKITLFRIIQEQLKNIITHSKASQVMIKTGLYRGKAILEITDDGVGFDADKKSKGIGLSNIYERARSLNGSVSLKTARGFGCTISVVLPAA